MPEISRFFGIIIRMFMELESPHNVPHFHAYYQEYTAVFGITSGDLLAGSLPKSQRRLVEAWAELHKEELLRDWQYLQEGRPPMSIKPLR